MRPTVSAPSEETIGQRIRRLRYERGLSQRELSGPGVSYAYISRLESGARKPSLKAMRHLARKLGVDPEYLETGEPIPRAARLELQLGDAELMLRLGPGEGREPERAEVLFADVLAETKGDGEPALAARARAGLGLLAAQRGDNAQAIRHLEDATGSGYMPPVVRPDVYQALGTAYLATDETRRAIDLWESVLELLRAEDPQDVPLIIRFISYVSWAYSEQGWPDRANEALEEAKRIAESEEVLPQVRVLVLWELARHAWDEQEDAVAALAHMRKAIALLEATEDTFQLARAHLLSAQLLSLDRNPDAAAFHLTLAEPLLEEGGAERSELGVLRAEQAKQAAYRGEPKRALELAQEAARLLGDDARHIGLREHALGAAKAAAGDVDAAAPHFEAALTNLAERHQFISATSIAREWAAILRENGRQEEAFETFERAIQMSDRTAQRKARGSM
jgi:transcriptional regulator with XRE-family HTH domain